MSAHTRRVVITGLGVVTPVGSTVASFWSSLLEGRSGAGPVTGFDVTDFSVRFAAEVEGFDPLDSMDPKELRRSDPYVQYGVAASKDAYADSGLDPARIDPFRIGVILGSGIGGITTFEKQKERLLQRGPGSVSPFTIPMLIANMASGQAAIHLEARGINFAPVSACASAAHATGVAVDAIRAGNLDVAVTGGCEAAISPIALSAFAKMGALSRRNDSPQTASRPFDADRDGFLLGEGAGVVILEEREHAMARGARIYAELAGYGATADAYHITMPHKEGLSPATAMTDCLTDSGVNADEVDYVNAHGTSTPLNDAMETVAIRRAFGEHADSLMVSSIKSMTGHALGAAAGIELVATALTLHHGRVPPTINYQTPDPACDLDCVPNEARDAKVAVAISNSLGFGGHNATLCVRRHD